MSGVVILGFQVHNVSRSACNDTGYPKVLLFGRAGRKLRFTVAHGHTEYGDPTADPVVDLQPNYEANFNFQWDRAHGSCVLIKTAQLAATRVRVDVTPDHRSVRVCGAVVHEAAVYNPAYPAE